MAQIKKNNVFVKIKRFAQHLYLKILRVKARPSTVAMGFACGIFAGCLPTLPPLPLQTGVSLGLSFILRGNVVTALVSMWISNPLNWVFFYFVQWRIGKFILPSAVADHHDIPEKVQINFLTASWELIITLFVGGIVLGIVLSIPSYFISKWFIIRYREERALRILKKQEQKRLERRELEKTQNSENISKKQKKSLKFFK